MLFLTFFRMLTLICDIVTSRILPVQLSVSSGSQSHADQAWKLETTSFFFEFRKVYRLESAMLSIASVTGLSPSKDLSILILTEYIWCKFVGLQYLDPLLGFTVVVSSKYSSSNVSAACFFPPASAILLWNAESLIMGENWHVKNH